MVMTWNAEADAKLFLGVLNLLQDSKTKLDCEYLANFMGPGLPLPTRLYTNSPNKMKCELDCLPGAIKNRIARLKRMAEKSGAVDGGNGDASPSGFGENANDNNENASAS
ncbi:hypothetical protein BJX63DRAFT_433956 [Aspergillus granulosus]|uniref:Uncharacterized protein n=1 Tax=Aspergillus granulosus TaxID=176169 RepID=A0ABR4H5M9_9EURO